MVEERLSGQSIPASREYATWASDVHTIQQDGGGKVVETEGRMV